MNRLFAPLMHLVRGIATAFATAQEWIFVAAMRLSGQMKLKASVVALPRDTLIRGIGRRYARMAHPPERRVRMR